MKQVTTADTADPPFDHGWSQGTSTNGPLPLTQHQIADEAVSDLQLQQQHDWIGERSDR
jgi:hypothetical protein